MFLDLLDRYLFRQFLVYFTLVLFALVSIYLLVDFFERVDNFMNANKSMSLVIKYFLLKIPFMADMIYPVCILLAGVISLGVLNHSHEYLALKAGGVSTFRICAPLITISLLLTLGALCMAEWVLPKTLVETNRIWYQEILNTVPKGVLREGRIYHKGIRGIYSFNRPDPNKNVFEQFSYAEWDDNYNLSIYLTAKMAKWQDDKWTLWDGQLKKASASHSQQHNITLFKEKFFVLPEGPDNFFVPRYKVNEQPISTLLQRARSRNPDPTQAWVDFHGRLSFVFLGLPLVLLGLPILLLLNQKWGRDLSLALPASCGLAFAAWGWWSTSQSLAKAYGISPFVSSWSIHIAISSLGIWLLIRQDR